MAIVWDASVAEAGLLNFHGNSHDLQFECNVQVGHHVPNSIQTTLLLATHSQELPIDHG